MVLVFTEKLLNSLKRWDRVLALEERRLVTLRKGLSATMTGLLQDEVFEKIIMAYHMEIVWDACLDTSGISLPTYIPLHYPMHAGFDIYDNWNELKGSNHPIADLNFCYAMSCLVFHPEFDWYILNYISHVRLHLLVDYTIAAGV